MKIGVQLAKRASIAIMSSLDQVMSHAWVSELMRVGAMVSLVGTLRSSTPNISIEVKQISGERGPLEMEISKKQKQIIRKSLIFRFKEHCREVRFGPQILATRAPSWNQIFTTDHKLRIQG